jgi:hypothetical protein
MKIQFRFVLLTLAAGAFAAVAAIGDDANPSNKPDADGYIRDWLMLAPISLGQDASGAEAIEKEQVAKEAALTPKAGDKAKAGDKELTWKSVRSKESSFDLNAILGGPNEFVAGYMVAYVVCDKELSDLTLLIGSNDQGRLYLNGKEVFKFTDTRALEKDSDKVEHVTLKKGVNTIVFKVINENNNWEGSVRFTDKNAKPVTGFTIKLSP